MRLVCLLALLLSLCLSASAQFTAVTGTVIDPNGLPYALGTITATLIIPSGSASPTLNGVAYIPPSQATGLDLAGNFRLQLADNTMLSPANTKWNFTVCSAGGSVAPAIGKGAICFSLAQPITISGPSQDITTNLNAIAPALTYVIANPANFLPIHKASVSGSGDAGISGAIAASSGGSGIIWADYSSNQNWTACPTWGAGSIHLMLYPLQYNVAVNCSVPANVTLQFAQGAMLCPASGTTTTIAANIIASAGTQIFCNALAGQGVISFAGNKAVNTLHPEWWGAVKNGIANDLPALQAASEAADTLTVASTQGATVDLGVGKYNISTGTWKIANANAQHHINITGVNPQGTVISADTSAGTAAIYLNLEKYVTLKEFSVTNQGTKAGFGIQFGGDAGAGTQTNGNLVQHVSVTNFTYGFYMSGGIGTSSEIEFDHPIMSGNTYGFFAANFNALNFLFLLPEIYTNTTDGFFITNGNMTVIGGASANNGVDFEDQGGNDGQVKIVGFRAETPVGDWLKVSGNNYTSIEDCIIHPSVTGSEVINAIGEIHIKNSSLNGYITWNGATQSAITLDHVSVNTPGTDWSLSNQLSSGATPFAPGFRFTNNTGVQANARAYIHDVFEASNGTMYPDLDGVEIARPSDSHRVLVAFDKGQGATLTLSANALAPYAYLHHVNDNGLMKNLNPVAGFGDWAVRIVLVPDQSFTTDTTGNIGKASTAVVGQPMTFYKDLANNKWYPSY